MKHRRLLTGVLFACTVLFAACDDDGGGGWYYDVDYIEITDDLPPPGNPEGACGVPEEALAADTATPTRVIGDGTPASCTSAAVVAAIAQGGIITFACGPDPVTILLEETAKIRNDTGPEIVIDGGGLVTLSGGDRRRILYMNTCDQAQVWTTPHCNDQDHPRLTVQNLSFIDGNAENEPAETAGGGAIFVRGGRFKVINSRFFGNTAAPTGPDVGGGAIRVFDQHEDRPVYVVHSTFGGRADLANIASNGGAVSSIGVNWTILNSVLSYNRAIGNGGNPAEAGTPGGGSGGAIYNDGNTLTLTLCGVAIEHNEVNAYGAAIFFVSNNHEGTIHIDDSVIRNNVNHSNHPWQILPGISGHSDTRMLVDADSIIE
jgi:hypothetical protein